MTATCTTCFKPLPPGSHFVNCPRCRERKKWRKETAGKFRRDITYDLPKRTEREVTLDEPFECERCGRQTTIRAVRDGDHECWSK